MRAANPKASEGGRVGARCAATFGGVGPMNAALPAMTAAAHQGGTEPRPLMPMSALMWRLDLDEKDVVVLIETQALLWSFNIAMPGCQRRAIRVLTESVENLVYSRKGPHADEESEWKRVARLIFPDKAIVTTGELARSLNCRADHIMHLVAAREIKLQPGTSYHRGPKGSAQFVTANAVTWLRKRRLML